MRTVWSTFVVTNVCGRGHASQRCGCDGDYYVVALDAIVVGVGDRCKHPRSRGGGERVAVANEWER